MEFSPKMSKALKISLLVLGAILLLLIGSTFGSHFSRNGNFNHNNGGCFGSGNNQFERGGRFEGRDSGRRFRMMTPREVDIQQSDSALTSGATSTQAGPSTLNSAPVIK